MEERNSSMNRKNMSFLMLALGGCVLAAFPGCSGGQSVDVPRVEISQLPAELQVIEYAASGNLAALQPLIQSNPALLHAKGARGGTPLHFAASNGQRKAVEFLLQSGANPRALDDEGFTAAQIAAQEGHNAVSRMIEEAAAQTPATAPY